MAEERFFLGIDGGGTGCRARLVSDDGTVIGEGQAGPATLRIGADKAWAAIMAAVQSALAHANSSIAFSQIFAGLALAGVSRSRDVAAIQDRARLFASARIVSDGHGACLGAHGGADGGIVSVGTGSIALAIQHGTEIRIGGYGLPVSDEGSGSDIGAHLLRHMLRVWDGRAQRSAFSDAWFAAFGGDGAAAAQFIHTAQAADYAAWAPFVLAQAQAGELDAMAIAQNAGNAISALINALQQRNVERIALTGGLASPLMAWLNPGVRDLLSPAQGDAVAGALLIARGLAKD